MFQNQSMPPRGKINAASRRSSTLLPLLLVLTFAFVAAPRAFSQSTDTNAPSSPAALSKADYVVIKPVANMYRKPTQTSDVVSQAIFGSNAIRIAGKWHWVNIRTDDGYTGWVQSSAVHKLKGQRYGTSGDVVRVSDLSANLYREPDVTKHAPLLTLPWQSRLEALPDKVDEHNRWLKVRLPDGQLAFVQNGDVSSDFAPLTIEQTIAVAKKFLGVTYTWGGSSDFGFDCSGFTQMLMRLRGMVMPRDADLQAAWSGVVPVERKDLQAGDLLFFGDRPDHITHTGMYIGNCEFIHDTTHEHPGVQISVLDEQPWTKLLVACRRPKT
ncbi:MAG TPA: NlpC/P60 family protein [Candidatus Sulfotelmatobacter sp.]|nr:NlpC/P60 family protein [Candidatus Sulfotelmatobacter sp.]